MCAATTVYLPSAVLCYLTADPFWAIIWFIGPAALGGVYIGTNFAILQSLAPAEMRAVMAAINLFILNIVGLGLGPVGVGFISDLTLPLALKAFARVTCNVSGYGLGRFTS